ncbi:MAG: signal peptide peptidase SppA [Alphaproteobacteria bacterium]|nr:signal peptide peptidase SppA [Alphaproteobacteria bacterium]
MSLNADTLIDRSYLKGQIAKWRAVAILVVVLTAILLTSNFASLTPTGNHIARVTVNGIIMDDVKRDELFKTLEEDKAVKAVILRIDSPGGTVVGGEELYLNVKRLREKKPVVVTMRSTATSAGYMAVLGADRVFAREGTLTGSIGVIMQTADVTGLAEKMGVEPITIKSGPNKATPNPFEKATPENLAVMREVVDDFYGTFVDMVAEGRNLPRERVLELADGRVYTGSQALELKLIDALGGEAEAVAWLETEKKIPANLDVTDREPEKEKQTLLENFVGKAMGSLNIFPEMRLDGLTSIWQPKSM